MSKYSQKISPIKNYHSPQVKSFQTPAQYLTQKNDTIFQQEYYQLKCDRLERENKQLYEHVRIIEIQNKQMKTQIQFYREQMEEIEKCKTPKTAGYEMNSLSPFSFKEQRLTQYDDSKLEDIQKLLKEIRLLKNTHDLQINQQKNQQKRLNKKILELQDDLHKKQLQCQSKCQNAQINIQERNKVLEKDTKQLRKSVIVYMEQRDQNENSIQLLKKQIEVQSQRIAELTNRQNTLLQEKNQLQETIKQKDLQLTKIVNKRGSQQAQNQEKNDDQYSKIRENLYEFGKNSRKTQGKESNLSVRMFNGYRYVQAQQVFEVSEALKSEIYRLQKELQNQQIQYARDINDLNFMIQRCQKDVKEKQADLVSLLTKVKPLLLEKHRMTTKQNISPEQSKKMNFQESRQTIGKNAFGLRMLDLYLKKYKMQ